LEREIPPLPAGFHSRAAAPVPIRITMNPSSGDADAHLVGGLAERSSNESPI